MLGGATRAAAALGAGAGRGRAVRAARGARPPRADPAGPTPASGAGAGAGRAASAAAAAAGGSPGGGLLEWRTYQLAPEGQAAYTAQSAEFAGLRREVFPNWKGFWSCDVGGQLNAVHHIYHWETVAQRSAHRQRAAQNKEWAAYVAAGKEFIRSQEATLFRPATAVMAAAGAGDVAGFAPEPAAAAVYELRTYHLSLGYDVVPKFLEAFVRGLPHKVAADPASDLAFFGFVEAGRLNEVVELWRYPSAEASMQAREAARGAPGWRTAVAEVAPLAQTFRSQTLVPADFSPVR